MNCHPHFMNTNLYHYNHTRIHTPELQQRKQIQVSYLAHHYWLQSKKSLTGKRESSARLDLCLSFCQISITEFILVKSTFDMNLLYNNQQDSLYPEGTQEASAGNKYILAASQKDYYWSKHWNPSWHKENVH